METKSLKNRQAEIELMVKNAQHGDTASFAKLYDCYISPIYRYVYYKVKQEDALDITESVFLKVWENLKLYRRRKGGFSAWIFKIAHNMVVDHYRFQRQHISIEDMNIVDESSNADPSLRAERVLNNNNLRKALSKLKKPHQQIIILRYINGFEIAEIAEIMKKSEGSIRILKFRALQILKKILEEMNITWIL